MLSGPWQNRIVFCVLLKYCVRSDMYHIWQKYRFWPTYSSWNCWAAVPKIEVSVAAVGLKGWRVCWGKQATVRQKSQQLRQTARTVSGSWGVLKRQKCWLHHKGQIMRCQWIEIYPIKISGTNCRVKCCLTCTSCCCFSYHTVWHILGLSLFLPVLVFSSAPPFCWTALGLIFS